MPGDIFLLEAGDNIPADCRLVEAYGVRVNNASVTGESMPQVREAEPCERNGELLHAQNVLLAGTSMVAGQAKAIVYATGSRSEFGTIAHLLQTNIELASPLKMEMAQTEPHYCGAVYCNWRYFLSCRMDTGWYLFMEGVRFADRHYCGAGARRIAGYANFIARAGNAAYGKAERTDSLSAVSRDIGVDDGDLHRQDRYA